jgi:hypothetical protein
MCIRVRTYVALAAIGWSTAGLFQRELTVNLGTQLAGGAIVLGAVVIQTLGEPEEPSVPPP